jgi:hypothetical protein
LGYAALPALMRAEYGDEPHYGRRDTIFCEVQ